MGLIQSKCWTDACDHPLDSFIGNYMWHNGLGRVSWDIYIYPDRDGPSVCIRYGEEDSEYISPGSLVTFTKSTKVMAKQYATEKDTYVDAKVRVLEYIQHTLAENIVLLCNLKNADMNQVLPEIAAFASTFLVDVRD